MVRLDQLVARLGGRLELASHEAPDVTHVHLDSRAATAGSLFAALPGYTFDGAEFAGQALLRGAVAVLAPRRLELDGDVPCWVHEDARRIVGEAASIVYGEPSQQLEAFAVTGTNGKTTVASLVGQLLRHCGRRPAILGTVDYRVAGDDPIPASHTTPMSPVLQRLLL